MLTVGKCLLFTETVEELSRYQTIGTKNPTTYERPLLEAIGASNLFTPDAIELPWTQAARSAKCKRIKARGRHDRRGGRLVLHRARADDRARNPRGESGHAAGGVGSGGWRLRRRRRCGKRGRGATDNDGLTERAAMELAESESSTQAEDVDLTADVHVLRLLAPCADAHRMNAGPFERVRVSTRAPSLAGVAQCPSLSRDFHCCCLLGRSRRPQQMPRRLSVPLAAPPLVYERSAPRASLRNGSITHCPCMYDDEKRYTRLVRLRSTQGCARTNRSRPQADHDRRPTSIGLQPRPRADSDRAPTAVHVLSLCGLVRFGAPYVCTSYSRR